MGSDNSHNYTRLICDIFMELPSRDLYPDYYQLIKAPIALAQIEERLVRKAYAGYEINSFHKDMKLLKSNACAYNQSGSQVFNDAIKIEKYVEKALKKVKDSLIDSMMGVTEDDKKKA